MLWFYRWLNIICMCQGFLVISLVFFFRWKCIAQIQTNPIFTEAIKVVRDLYNFCFKIAKKRVKDLKKYFSSFEMISCSGAVLIYDYTQCVRR